MVFVFIVVATPCFVTGWVVSNITWVRQPIVKRVLHYQPKLQVLGITILDRKNCDTTLGKFKKNNMGLDYLCAGSNALNKSPCNVSGCLLNT